MQLKFNSNIISNIQGVIQSSLVSTVNPEKSTSGNVKFIIKRFTEVT